MIDRDNLTRPQRPYPEPHTLDDEKRDQVWKAINYNGDRIDALQLDMRETVTQAVKEAMPNALLSADEHRWVQLAIKREAQTIAFRQSVIDKTLTGFVWAMIVGLGVMVKEYFAAHGWKP